MIPDLISRFVFPWMPLFSMGKSWLVVFTGSATWLPSQGKGWWICELGMIGSAPSCPCSWCRWLSCCIEIFPQVRLIFSSEKFCPTRDFHILIMWFNWVEASMRTRVIVIMGTIQVEGHNIKFFQYNFWLESLAELECRPQNQLEY